MPIRRGLSRWMTFLVVVLAAVVAPSTHAQGRPDAGAAAAYERQDLGVPPTPRLHAGAMHGPTPASIPGGQVVTTQGLAALVQGRQAPYVIFDVLGDRDTLPGAVPAAWLAQPGSFDDGVQRQAVQLFGWASQGRRDVALVFYCRSRECWMSYNAALRAIQAGYANVLWYRGGIDAWRAAGLPTQPAQAQQPQQVQVQPGAPGPGAAAGGTFVPVTPQPRGAAGSAPPGAGAPPAGELRIAQGQFFSFALPPGWRVGEEGQHAVSLVAPDNRALTVVVGNSGLPLNSSPVDYAQRRLAALAAQGVQMSAARPARPAAGFSQAVEFEVAFTGTLGPTRGVLKVSSAPGYDSTVMAMTAALASADQWPNYSRWLPMVADQVAATNGAAFGRRGIMAQNLQNSIAFGQAASAYRDWSQKNWQGVVDARNDSQDRRNLAFRENLGAVQTHSNPFGFGPPVELPTTHRHYWQDRQGRVIGTNDPTADPNVGSTGEWRRMERVQR